MPDSNASSKLAFAFVLAVLLKGYTKRATWENLEGHHFDIGITELRRKYPFYYVEAKESTTTKSEYCFAGHPVFCYILFQNMDKQVGKSMLSIIIQVMDLIILHKDGHSGI